MLVFMFWINDNDISTYHQATQNFQLDGIALTSSGSGKDHAIGILQTKAIKENQTIVVAINTIENTVVTSQFTGDKRKRRSNGRRIHVKRNQQFIMIDGQGGIKALFGLKIDALGINQTGTENIFYSIRQTI